jgi:uncharacterized protein
MRSPNPLLGVFVDASAFGAIAKRTDENQSIARDIFRGLALENRSLITTNFIVAETHALVLARGGRELALQALDLIERTTDLIERVAVEDESEARRILQQYDNKTFSYTDATSFAVMERLGLRDVFTFDRHFEQFGFSPVKPS